jgi:hypothetical protein
MSYQKTYLHRLPIKGVKVAEGLDWFQVDVLLNSSLKERGFSPGRWPREFSRHSVVPEKIASAVVTQLSSDRRERAVMIKDSL